jgi:hypothetical protein
MFAILDETPDATFQYYKNKIIISVPIGHSSVESYVLALTQPEFLNKMNTLFGISDDIIRASKTIKTSDTENYEEISYGKEMKITLGSLVAIAGVAFLFPIIATAWFMFAM